MAPRQAGAASDRGRDGRASPARPWRASRLGRAVTRAFSIDPRALAALRIAIGLVLLADLLIRSGDLVAFYTDQGVLPRTVLREQYGAVAALAFAHGLSGAPWVQGLLFVVAGAVALALVVGYRTRVATIVSFLLLVSLHARNPVILNAGDRLFLMLLLWSVFLPLGGRWSVDAMRGRVRREPVANIVTVALLVQAVIVYVVNGTVKLRGETWVSGRAIRLVFELDHLTVRLGDTLAQFPLALEVLGWLWLAMLLTSFLLIVLPGWPRAAFAGLFVAMHLGMFLTMRLGLFPLVSIAALLPFIPTTVWDTAVTRAGPQLRRRLDVDAWRSRLDRTAPRHSGPLIPTSYRRPIRQAGHLLVAMLLVVVLVWNAAGLGHVDAPPEVTVVVDPEERRWDMFAPDPRGNDGWYVVPGELESGETTDAFHGGPVSWERPPELAGTFPSHRWFVYLLELPRPGTEPLRAAFADYLCRRWNADQEDDLVAVTVVYVVEPARLDGPVGPEPVELGRYACPAA